MNASTARMDDRRPALTAEELEDQLRHWGRVYGQRPPREWEEDHSLTPSPSAEAMARAPASGMGRARRLGLIDHVNVTQPGARIPNWSQYAVTCTETRSFRARSQRPDPRADWVEREAMSLRNFDTLLGVVLRLHYCTRGSLEEKAQAAGAVLGLKVPKRTYRTALEQARWWMRGALSAG